MPVMKGYFDYEECLLSSQPCLIPAFLIICRICRYCRPSKRCNRYFLNVLDRARPFPPLSLQLFSFVHSPLYQLPCSLAPVSLGQMEHSYTFTAASRDAIICLNVQIDRQADRQTDSVGYASAYVMHYRVGQATYISAYVVHIRT